MTLENVLDYGRIKHLTVLFFFILHIIIKLDQGLSKIWLMGQIWAAEGVQSGPLDGF